MKQMGNRREDDLLRLLNMQMPSIVIEKMLQMSEKEVSEECKKLEKSVLNLDQARPGMLKMYVGSEVFERDDEFKIRLKHILYEELSVEVIHARLRGAAQTLADFTEIRYTDDVPEGYRTLIERMFEYEHHNSSLIFNSMIMDMKSIARSENLLPEKFSWGYTHFIYDIIKKHTDKVRNEMRPKYSLRFCKLIDDKLAENTRRKEAIEGVYGLHREPWSDEEKKGKNDEVNYVAHIAMLELRKKITDYLKPIDDIISQFEEFKENTRNEIAKIKKDYHEYSNLRRQNYFDKVEELAKIYKIELLHEKVPSFESENAQLILNELLYKNIKDVGLKPRIVHVFSERYVKYIWEILPLSPSDLMQVRNLGVGSVKSIIAFAEENNLPLGIEFSEAEREYLKAKTSN